MSVRLRPLRLDDEHEARAAQDELGADGFSFLLDWDPTDTWPRYLEKLRRLRTATDVAPGMVSATFLVAEHDGTLVGRASIRHELNDFLAHEGGHIGYGVRPQHRRRGFATEILRQSLIIARAEGVQSALVTCDEGNVASATIIERAGGVLEDVRVGADGVPKRRYWIA